MMFWQHWIFFSTFCIDACWGVWCYSCQSASDDGCGVEDFDLRLHLVNITLEVLPGSRKETCRFCIKRSFIGNSGKREVSRSCEWHRPLIFDFESYDECLSPYDNEVQEEICLCTTDKCNRGVQKNVPGAALIRAVAFSSLLMIRQYFIP